MPEYDVYHVAIGEERRRSWTFRDRAAAEAKREQMTAHVREVMTTPEGKATLYTVVEEHVVTDFTVPCPDQPRDLYYQRYDQYQSRPGTGSWEVADVRVYRKGPGTGTLAGEYHRNYPGRPPFEPFRQFTPGGAEHHYALVSAHYQQADVIDLGTGQVIASEDKDDPGWGFCPAGFYVPDWRDCHDDSSFPGSWYWDDRHDRWPDGTLGFTWGCYWGDDNGWKVQALDLSRVGEGVIRRDDRFGYQYLDTGPRGRDPREFIDVHPGERGSGPVVTFTVPRQFRVTGEPTGMYDGKVVGWAVGDTGR